MKVFSKAVVAVLLLILTVAAGTIGVFAADKDGWTVENGKSYYYENGTPVTGTKKIGEHTYKFDSKGVLIGALDGHKAIGTADTMQSAAYKAALAGRTQLVNITFDDGDSLVGGREITSSGGTYTSHQTFTSKKGASGSVLAVIKSSSGKLLSRGNGFAYSFKDSTAASSSDCYFDTQLPTTGDINPKGASIIYEAEYRLGEDYTSEKTLNFLQVIYRNQTPTLFNAILTLKGNGYVYAQNYSSSEYLFKLNSDEYTRVSIAIHPSRNTFDVYVNGILVKADILYSKSTDVDVSKSMITSIRSLQFSSSSDYEGSFTIDNVNVYRGDEPVCVDKTTKPRNGAYVEGSYIRYYKDNLILTGKQTLTGEYFGMTLDKELLNFSAGYAFLGSRATVKNGETVISDSIVSENKFTYPAAVTMDGKDFIAWKATSASGKTYVAFPGDVQMLEENITVEALGIEFAMLNGASVKKSGDPSLRFVAKVSRADYDAFVASGMEIAANILIAPSSYYDDLYGYRTLENIMGSDCDKTKVYDVKADTWLAETDGYYYFAASTGAISDHTEKYSAIAYITLKGDKLSTTLYSDYSDKNNSRNVYEVAKAAYNDRVTEATAGYEYTVKFGGAKTYSSYTAEENAHLASFIDKYLSIKIDEKGVAADGKYYELPCKLTKEDTNYGYNVKLTGNLSGVEGVSLNGRILAAGEYTKTSSELTFDFDIGAQELQVEEELEYYDKWYLAYPGESYIYTKNGQSLRISAFDTPASNGETEGYYWCYDDSDSISLSKTAFGLYDDLTGPRYTSVMDVQAGTNVYDMSDWKTMEFSIYMPEKYSTATFLMIFYSDNGASDGSDYYSHSITVYPGWNTYTLKKAELGGNRQPLGWDKITSISFTSTGWNQVNDMNTELYITSIAMYDIDFGNNAKLSYSELNDSATFAVGGFGGIVNGEFYPSNPGNYNTKAFKKGDVYYLPANVLAVANDEDAVFYSGYGKLEFTYDGKKYILANGTDSTADGEKLSLKYPAEVQDGAVYLAAEDLMEIFGYDEIYTDVMGLVALSNTPELYDHDKDYNKIADIINKCIYVRPTGETVLEDLQEYSGAKHPYIIMTQDDFDALNYYKKYDTRLQSYITNALEKNYGIGKNYYEKDPVNYNITDGVRLLSISREAMARIIPWSMLYKLYEFDSPSNAKLIAERLWKELQAIAYFQDWHPSHYLDTAELAYPVAIAYDWLYDYWTPERRAVLEGMLYGFALKTTTTLGGSYGLSSATNNWNGVCNGGIMSAALALAGIENDSITWKANSTARPLHGETGFSVTEPVDGNGTSAAKLATVTKYTTSKEDVMEDIATVISAGISAIEKGMWVYGPDGGYEEGPGYWSYGTTYTMVFIASLDSACGTNYGIYESPGFEHSVYYTTYIGSKNTTWGFHDGGSGSADTNIASWFAKKSGDGNINTIRYQAIDNGWKNVNYYDVIFYDPHIVENSVNLGKDAYYSLDTIMTFRDSWNADKSVFVGLHGGDNQASHGDLDIGNFVINVDGTYMICDLGAESYNVEGYFGGYRWSYYRKRAEGQNTLVMLPSGQSWNGKTGDPNGKLTPVPDQVATGVSRAERFESGENSAFGVIDMKPAYEFMREGKRGLYYTDNRTTIVVQDEATFTRAMDIWWFAHTQGEITISDDGRTAIIRRNGVMLYAELVTEVAGAKLTAMKAESLDAAYTGDTIPNPDYPSGGYSESSRASFSKLCVTAKNVNSLKMAVVFKVIYSENDIPELGSTYAWQDIDEWKVD